MSIKDGGPAFPLRIKNFEYYNSKGEAQYSYEHELGMSLRDYFAAKAMQALVADALNRDGMAAVATIAKDAYRMADAMLVESIKQG